MISPPPRSPLFPYTTLFRSDVDAPERGLEALGDVLRQRRVRIACEQRERVAGTFVGRAHNCCAARAVRSEEHTSELQSHHDLVCRLLLEKKKKKYKNIKLV